MVGWWLPWQLPWLVGQLGATGRGGEGPGACKGGFTGACLQECVRRMLWVVSAFKMGFRGRDPGGCDGVPACVQVHVLLGLAISSPCILDRASCFALALHCVCRGEVTLVTYVCVSNAFQSPLAPIHSLPMRSLWECMQALKGRFATVYAGCLGS